MIYSMLDPDGTWAPWIAVIVSAKTGVTYSQQCGGVSNSHKSLEGFLIPIAGSKFDADLGPVEAKELTVPFHNGRNCSGFEGKEMPIRHRDMLKTVVEQLPYWKFANLDDCVREKLKMDESRIVDLCEAWVPVITPDGPGVLVWDNCD